MGARGNSTPTPAGRSVGHGSGRALASAAAAERTTSPLRAEPAPEGPEALKKPRKRVTILTTAGPEPLCKSPRSAGLSLPAAQGFVSECLSAVLAIRRKGSLLCFNGRMAFAFNSIAFVIIVA